MRKLLRIIPILLILWGSGDANAATPDENLLEASKNGNVEAARTAIDAGANVNTMVSKTTALIVAAQKGHKEIVRLLLAQPVDVNQTASGGFTALMNASYYGHGDIVKLLLEYGADVNVQAKNGATALSFAKKKKNREIIRILENTQQFVHKKNESESQDVQHGTDDVKKVEQLNQQVAELFQQGKYAQGVPFAKQALAISEQALGPKHAYTAVSLGNLALLYKAMGNYTQAEPLAKRALAILEQVLGPEHPSTVVGLGNLAGLYHEMGNYARAEPLLQRALAISEQALGPKHPDTARELNNLALLYQAMGNYAQAEPLFQRALAISEQTLRPEHPHTAAGLDNLAGLYYEMGNYTQAEPLFQRALAIREQALGPEHPYTALSLNNLALLYQAMGNYAQSEPLLQRALAIREKALGAEHSDTAGILGGLAGLYYEMGNYTQAEPLFQRALAIREQALGPEHPYTALSLNNLALLYQAMGNYAQSEPLAKRALAIREQALGPEHPNTALSLSNLATLYYEMGKYTQAEPLAKRALAISEQVLGPKHAYTAVSLGNLALLYQAMGNYTQAEPLAKRALAISEQVLGPKHAYTATSLNNLAMLYHDMGAYAQAEPLLQRALAIREQALGPEHPYTALSLNNLAFLYATEEHYDQAWTLFKRAQRIDSTLIEQIMGFTSEAQKFAFLATRQANLEAAISLIVSHLAHDPTARRDTLNLWLQRKGVILETQRRFQEALFQSGDPEALQLFQTLSQVRAQLMRLTFAGPGKETPESYTQRLDALQQHKEELEAQLSRLSQRFAAQRHQRAKADTQQVAATLSAHSALLEFAKVRFFNFKAVGKEKQWQPAHYLAFVLHAGKPEQVGLIDLGDAEKIDKAIEELRRRIQTEEDELHSRIQVEKDVIEAARNLHNQVFAPLLQDIGDVKDVFISPDGNLNLIPFDVLIGPDGRFLIEDYTFTYLAAGRDLIGVGERSVSAQPSLLIGDPDFNLVFTQETSEVVPGSLSGIFKNFSSLPGTKEEVETISELLGQNLPVFCTQPAEGDIAVRLCTQENATEDALFQETEETPFQDVAPRILHIATHGFFLSDQNIPMREIVGEGSAFIKEFFHEDASKNLPTRIGIRGIITLDGKPLVFQDNVRLENPLLRSGIILAGVNSSLNTGRSDGIVTAEKVLELNLHGTELVVLSACETGLGDVQVGEGVYGLRRALLQVGAQRIVMSFWKVSDQHTKALMVQFYKNYLAGVPGNQALRQAALQQMEAENGKFKFQPRYWGGFMFLGVP